MGRLDEDLRKVLRIKAASDAVYMWGGKEAAKKVQATETACFNFVHEHAYEILGLFHLNEMTKDDVGSGAYAENAEYYRDAQLEDLGLNRTHEPPQEPVVAGGSDDGAGPREGSGDMGSPGETP